jgi:hypothetical protein
LPLDEHPHCRRPSLLQQRPGGSGGEQPAGARYFAFDLHELVGGAQLEQHQKSSAYAWAS